ncbi:MAG: DUF1064 domain-containing protein [Phycisphaerae bacterium]|nr:DUF1064 domain-containing protein [Phycisphaerae bacterium]MDD5239958.1 DUF1064 domain-containing protein [Candidatus Nanoarchaeia archaeon]
MSFTEEWLEEYQKRQGKPQSGILLVPAEKPSKYRNNRVKVDGLRFDSQFEADYYADLKLQLRAGVINGFCRQPRFPLANALEYVADFVVWNLDGTAEIIDTKGIRTDLYIAKKKVFMERYPKLGIREVYRE